MCVRHLYNYKVIISSLINIAMSKTGYVYSIIDYTTLLAYLKINFEIIIIVPESAGYSGYTIIK